MGATTANEPQLRNEDFHRVGREQLAVLLEHGLRTDSYVLDIGCGELRCGRWLIPLLDTGHYCGIEPVARRISQGLEKFLDPAIVEIRKPRFDHNSDFDYSVFGVQFTHFVARSIWSHASKAQIEAMLDGVVAHGAPDAVLLASFRAKIAGQKGDYKGQEWVGRGKESDKAGIVGHDVDWIKETCLGRGLVGEISSRGPVKKNGQVWAVVRKPADAESVERLRRDRATAAARELKHNFRMAKAAMLKLIEASEIEA